MIYIGRAEMRSFCEESNKKRCGGGAGLGLQKAGLEMTAGANMRACP